MRPVHRSLRSWNARLSYRKWQRYVLVGLFGAATVVLFIGAVRAQASKEALMLALLGSGFAGLTVLQVIVQRKAVAAQLPGQRLDDTIRQNRPYIVASAVIVVVMCIVAWVLNPPR